MRCIRNPDRGQLARPVQFRQHDGITTVRLHAVTSFHGDQRRRDDRAIVPQLDKLAVEAIATGPGLVAEMKLTADSAQLVDQFAYMVGPVQNRPSVPDLAAPPALRDRDRDRRFVDIQPDERAILHLVSPPSLRLGAGPFGATLEQRMPRERPPAQSAHSAIMGSRGYLERLPLV